MIECLECGKEFKRISNTHLLKCCGLTMKEYAIKHGVPLESLIDKECLRSGLLTVEEKLNKLEKNNQTRRSKQLSILTDEEYQIILGSLLGDGYLKNGRELPDSTYLVLEHGIKQLNYLLWKGQKLRNLDSKFYQYYTFNQVKHRYATRNQVRSKSLYLLGDLGKKIYKSDDKFIDISLLETLNPLGLAIWYMDDGTYNKGYSTLSTQSLFNTEDNNIIVDFLKSKFNIQGSVKFDINDQPYIFFLRDQAQKLFDIIEPHMFYNMQYKIGKQNLPELELSKRVIFDSAHFLDEYDGKCSQLHGGRYELWVTIKGPINPDTGMVLDYGYMNKVLKKYIVDEFDHHCLNYQTSDLGWRSTTELICMYMWKVLIEFFPNLHRLEFGGNIRTT